MAKHPKLADELESAFKEGATISIAAALCGLHTQTVRMWIRKGACGDPYYMDFYRRMRKAMAGFLMSRVRNVVNATDNTGSPVWQANMAMLEKLNREEFGREAPEATPSEGIRAQLIRGIQAIDEEIATGLYQGEELQKKADARNILHDALVRADRALAEKLFRHGPTESDMIESRDESGRSESEDPPPEGR